MEKAIVTAHGKGGRMLNAYGNGTGVSWVHAASSIDRALNCRAHTLAADAIERTTHHGSLVCGLHNNDESGTPSTAN